MERKRQRELALGAAALVLVAVAAWTTQSMARRGPAAVSPAGAAAGAAPEQPSAVSELDLKALDAERPEPEETTRNPFRFRERSALPPPPSVTRPPAVTIPAATGPAELPPPPRITLKYIGEMTDPAKPGQKIAILSDGRGVYYGRENDVIEGRYRLLKIGAESVDLAHLDGRGRQTIRQTGQ